MGLLGKNAGSIPDDRRNCYTEVLTARVKHPPLGEKRRPANREARETQRRLVKREVERVARGGGDRGGGDSGWLIGL